MVAEIQYRNRLSVKQSKAAVLVALLVGLLMALIEMSVELNSERSRLVSSVTNLVEVSLPTAYKSAYRLDSQLAATIIDGMFTLESIQEVVILDDSGDILARRYRQEQVSSSHWLASVTFGDLVTYRRALGKVGDSAQPYVGDVFVKLDPVTAAQGFINKTLFILTAGLLRNVILAILLGMVFQRLTTNPILQLEEKLQKLELQGEQLVEIAPGHEQDELGRLVEAINAQIRQFRQLMEREESLERKIGQSGDHADQLERCLDAFFQQDEIGVALIDSVADVVRVNNKFLDVFDLHVEKDGHLNLDTIFGDVSLNQSRLMRDVLREGDALDISYMSQQGKPKRCHITFTRVQYIEADMHLALLVDESALEFAKQA